MDMADVSAGAASQSRHDGAKALQEDKAIRFKLATYGCTLNQSDSNIMRGVLAQNGCVEVEDDSKADVIVINSCTVKEATENKIAFRLAKYARAGKPLVLAGCMSVNEKLVSYNAPNASIVGTSSLNRIFDAVESAIFHMKNSRKTGKSTANGTVQKVFKDFSSKENLPRSREGIIGKVAIAEGCLSSCTFCQTKLARGRLFSYKPEAITNEVSKWAAAGAREIQLTGQDTGAYGAEIRSDIGRLLEAVCSVKGDFKVRLGMANPEHALKHLDRLLVAFENRKMYKFLHIPVQSGSDSVLEKMKREYSVSQFMEVADAFKSKFPGMILATDVIVGFPQETFDDFEMTLGLIRKARFDIVNVSKFSPRPFTKAAGMEQVPNNEKKRRAEICSALCRKIAFENNKKWIGKKASFTVTEKQKTFTGRDDYYRQVAIAPGSIPRGFEVALGQDLEAKITGARIGCIVGQLLF